MALSLQHLHLVSSNKIRLAQWYCSHLGFTVIEDLEMKGERNGPVLISSDGGQTSLSIFNSLKNENTSLPAFGSDRELFLNLYQQFGCPRIYDHYLFLSFYVKDLDENKLEICSWEYEELKKNLSDRGIAVFLMSPETYTP